MFIKREILTHILTCRKCFHHDFLIQIISIILSLLSNSVGSNYRSWFENNNRSEKKFWKFHVTIENQWMKSTRRFCLMIFSKKKQKNKKLISTFKCLSWSRILRKKNQQVKGTNTQNLNSMLHLSRIVKGKINEFSIR